MGETMSDIGRQLRLPDGRALGYAVWGETNDSDAPVIMAFHGTPGSRFDLQPSPVMQHPEGARIVAVDRPGVGLSDPLPGRTLTAFVDDVETLADHLGIDRFGVLGYSGGGSYALAVAAGLPGRVTDGTLVGALAPPPGRSNDDGTSFALRLAMEARKVLPVTAPVIAIANAVLSRFPTTALGIASLDMPPSDRETLRDARSSAHLLATYREASRSGTAGAASDLDLVLSDWGFDLAAVKAPIAIWQGAADTIVPVAHANWFAKELPNSERFDLAADGHTLLYRHSTDILAELSARLR
jgi:pimeloyl-ACP methyl ester carboxylesterase